LLLVVVVVVVAALAAGALGGLLPGGALCQVGGTISECGQLSGVVLAVEGDGPASVDRFRLRTQDGRVVELAIERLSLEGGGKPAAHLREHLVDGQPILVDYKVDDDRHVALRYTDAP
jgi:hypothetical protein